MKVLDLFSGIGGFSLGLERAGMTTVAFCEIDPFCRRVLAKHWPEVPCYDDVCTLTANRLRADGINVDVICGGFPCQDISIAGKGAGLAGERSGLWREYARLIGEIRPRYVIVENVAALLHRGLGYVLGDLAALGYDAEWHCISASAVGAPHRRDRVWIVAYPHGQWELQPQGGVLDQWGRLGYGGSDVENANCIGRPEMVKPIFGRAFDEGATDSFDYSSLSRRQSWWRVEPDVGRTFDGFPSWLVRCVGKGLSYAESQRATQILRGLWSDHVSETLWQATRGLERIQQAQVLFSFVREYEAGTDEARLLVAGQKTSKGFLRSLRNKPGAGSAPHKPEQNGQPSTEHPDALQPVPRFLACDGETPWSFNSWEDATPRVAHGVPNRVDRLGCLGNAVVPQIPELIGRAIMESA